MKIIKYDMWYVYTDDGQSRQYNEVIWHYRSACCGAAIKRDGDRIVCRMCDQEPDLISKNIVKQQIKDMESAIDVLPAPVRQQALDGFLTSIEKDLTYLENRSKIIDARITHIKDGGL